MVRKYFGTDGIRGKANEGAILPSAEMPAVARHCQPVPVTPCRLGVPLG